MMQMMAFGTESPLLQTTCNSIVADILCDYDENAPFGFKTQIPILVGDKPQMIDNVGLLDGTIGTLLALLFAKTNSHRIWPSIFLL